MTAVNIIDGKMRTIHLFVVLVVMMCLMFLNSCTAFVRQIYHVMFTTCYNPSCL